MKRSYILGIIVIIIFGVIALFALKEAIIPYVKFPEARASGRSVQIAGKVVPGSARYEKNQSFVFTLESPEGDRMAITYRGTKPGNFDQATGVVARGRFMDGSFQAARLLVKCPSKYEDRLEDPALAEQFYQSEKKEK